MPFKLPQEYCGTIGRSGEVFCYGAVLDGQGIPRYLNIAGSRSAVEMYWSEIVSGRSVGAFLFEYGKNPDNGSYHVGMLPEKRKEAYNRTYAELKEQGAGQIIMIHNDIIQRNVVIDRGGAPWFMYLRPRSVVNGKVVVDTEWDNRSFQHFLEAVVDVNIFPEWIETIRFYALSAPKDAMIKPMPSYGPVEGVMVSANGKAWEKLIITLLQSGKLQMPEVFDAR